MRNNFGKAVLCQKLPQSGNVRNIHFTDPAAAWIPGEKLEGVGIYFQGLPAHMDKTFCKREVASNVKHIKNLLVSPVPIPIIFF